MNHRLVQILRKSTRLALKPSHKRRKIINLELQSVDHNSDTFSNQSRYSTRNEVNIFGCKATLANLESVNVSLKKTPSFKNRADKSENRITPQFVNQERDVVSLPDPSSKFERKFQECEEGQNHFSSKRRLSVAQSYQNFEIPQFENLMNVRMNKQVLLKKEMQIF